jgi:hypothetical protein
MSEWHPECESLFEAARGLSVEPGPGDRARVASAVASRLAVGVGVVTAATPAAAAGPVAAAGAVSPALKVLLSMTLVLGGVATAVVATSHSRGTVEASSRGALVVAHPLVAHDEGAAVTSPLVAAPSAAPAAAPSAAASTGGRTTIAHRHPRRPGPDAVAPALEPSARPFGGSSTEAHLPPAAAPGAAFDDLGRAEALPPAPSATAYDAAGEIVAVRRIDEALRRGDFSGATQLLDEHDATFGAGHLVQECEGARILALCGSGQTRAAARKACSFFSAYPRSPMRARIEQVCPVRCSEEEP